ncbi:ribonuclease HII [Flavobacteriaceae bacterium F89]|uniref:Ribonuclease HII n=1 Tax=Cerina litoralis TaxID=2874477 RepID=A0AAE3ERX5_9FLAO|nr:ribonuclease HII [Cerina litoralis]MCG2459818.1 ribonuclease HII [Cerina litoralis]
MKHRILFLLLLVVGCHEQQTSATSLLYYIPKNTSLLISINDNAVFDSGLVNNDFIKSLRKNGIYEAVFNKLKDLDYVNPKSKSILAFAELGKGKFEFIYVTNNSPDLFQTDEVKNKVVETLIYENFKIYKYVLDGSTFFSLVVDDRVVVSSSQILLENLIRSKGERIIDPTLEKLYRIANSDKPATIFINVKDANGLIHSVAKEGSTIDLSHFSDWISLDIDMGQDHIDLNGVSMANDSVKQYINLFENTTPLENITPKFAPANADAIASYTFGEYSRFSKNQQFYLDKSVVVDTLFQTVEEIGVVYLNSKKIVLLNTFGSERILQFLDKVKKSRSEYQGTEIVQLNTDDFLNLYFNPLIKGFQANYYTLLDNAFIFSPDQESLQTIIGNYKNGTTFNTTSLYTSAKGDLADESTILFISNTDGIPQLLHDGFTDQFYDLFQSSEKSPNTFAAQWVTDDHFYHTNVVIRKMEKATQRNTVSPLFTVQLDSDLATDPQFVTNHRTKKREIVVQDKDNNLYLISTDGKVLWKKKLEGRIQGKIEQVDLYNNGRLQLAFTTDNQFLILDRNGDEVKPFTFTYQGGNLNPLAVFDYDHNKKYRFLVTQGEKIFMYNNQGEIVKGFKYTKTVSPVLGAPEHFRLKGKDYLVFKLANGELKILNRVGKTRVKVGAKISFSDNEVYLYDDTFTTTDEKGILFQIDTKGKLKTANLSLNKDHGIIATGRTLVVMNDNILNIRGKKVSLELGVYTKPKLFFVNDKIYVSVTDIQNQKIYLFDSNAEPIPNFPVYGTSPIDLSDMDNDKKPELVSKETDNSLMVQKIN